MQGFSQRPGVYFDHPCTPVRRHATFRNYLAIRAANSLEFRQLGVKVAFLNVTPDGSSMRVHQMVTKQQYPGLYGAYSKLCMDYVKHLEHGTLNFAINYVSLASQQVTLTLLSLSCNILMDQSLRSYTSMTVSLQHTQSPNSLLFLTPSPCFGSLKSG